jgi:hypothetical protein
MPDGPKAGEPDPLLASSEGDEAILLAERDSRKHRLRLAAGVAVGSAAIAAAMLFWGQKESSPKAAGLRHSHSG